MQYLHLRFGPTVHDEKYKILGLLVVFRKSTYSLKSSQSARVCPKPSGSDPNNGCDDTDGHGFMVDCWLRIIRKGSTGRTQERREISDQHITSEFICI